MPETAFLHPFQILKASPEERTGAIKVLVRASSEKEDLQGEVILKSAYADTGMRNEFLAQGYFDYNHLTDIIDKEIQDLRTKGKLSGTVLVNLQKAKIESIIGGVEQIGFKDDFPQSLGIRNDGLYIQGRLFPENKFAEEIGKGLQAGFKGWGASVSGYARPQDYQGKTIRKIQLRKCALAPLQEVYNPDTSVQLIKGAVLLRDIEKSSLPVPIDSQNSESLDRLFRIERKLDLLSKLFLSDPNTQDSFLDLIFSDIANRTKTQESKLGSSWVRSVLSDEFYLEGEDLENFTDLLFLKLNGES